MSVFRAVEVPFRPLGTHRPLTPHPTFRVVRALSGPEVSHGRTPTDVLSNLLEELLMGPPAAQPHHDAATPPPHRCRHLDQQQPPRRRLTLAQRVVATTAFWYRFRAGSGSASTGTSPAGA